MATVFITGSTDGLGYMAAERLMAAGHQVLLHARHEEKAEKVLRKLPGARGVVTGDLSRTEEIRSVAEQVNRVGPMDSIIHNAGVGYQEPLIRTKEGLPHVLAINSLAPYLLTCLIERPRRLVYISSGMHLQGDPRLNDLRWEATPWNGTQAYSDTKLHNLLLALAVARRWPNVYSNAVSPGWVATKMGGSGAPDSLEEAPQTQVWLAAGEEEAANVSGKYLYHQREADSLPQAHDPHVQDYYLARCQAITGVTLPN